MSARLGTSGRGMSPARGAARPRGEPGTRLSSALRPPPSVPGPPAARGGRNAEGRNAVPDGAERQQRLPPTRPGASRWRGPAGARRGGPEAHGGTRTRQHGPYLRERGRPAPRAALGASCEPSPGSGRPGGAAALR